MIIIYVSYTGSCGHIYTLYIYIYYCFEITIMDDKKEKTMCMYMSEVTSSNPTFHHFRLARSPPGVTIGAVGGMPWGAKASIRKFPTSGVSGHLGIGDERPATIPQAVSVVSVASEHRKEVIHLNMDSSKFIYVPIQVENTFVAYRFDVNGMASMGGSKAWMTCAVGQQCNWTTSKLLDIW